jgi:hypothetical protein
MVLLQVMEAFNGNGLALITRYAGKQTLHSELKPSHSRQAIPFPMILEAKH